MWVADHWKEYEVIDCSGGEKLERWGKYLLMRPDPQVIWNTPRVHSGWKHPNAHYHRSTKGGGEWEFFDLPEEWAIHYELPLSSTEERLPVDEAAISGKASSTKADVSKSLVSTNTPTSKANANINAARSRRLTFRLKPFNFKHTGLFPEQACNWDWFAPLIADAVKSGREVKVLNLFAYTGGATLAAAAAGAKVTHVDASKGMVSWAKENAAASGLDGAPIRWLVDDCTKFIEREIRRGNHYDAIIMDPPSYGRGPKGEIWKLEDSIYPFLTLCAQVLSPNPLFVLLNSYTTGLQPAVLTYMLSTVLKEFPGTVMADEVGLPVTSTGLVLPCGASGRFLGDINC